MDYNRRDIKRKAKCEYDEYKIERVNPEQIDETIMEEAGRLIAEGELVAFPTETVYGLGGDALHPEAARKIYAAKDVLRTTPDRAHCRLFRYGTCCT